MAGGTLAVSGIDHIELLVPDRYEAAGWYHKILGLEILAKYKGWSEPLAGPLMLSSDGGMTKLALFHGQPQQAGTPAGIQRIAFRTDGAGFLEFLNRLETLDIRNSKGERVTRQQTVDHEMAVSIYFCDPWGTRLELTTYDVEAVRETLRTI
jgi:catechol 2,3-dioxygenase-like lactoylglutathione lyase family enzyme